MSSVYARAILAGILFGVWPLLMNYSGLQGNTRAAVFAGLAFLTVLPFAFREGLPTMQFPMVYALAAGIVGGVGLIVFNAMFAGASTKQVGSLFIIMVLVQIAVPAIYHMVVNGSFDPKKIAGLGAAAVAAYLLS